MERYLWSKFRVSLAIALTRGPAGMLEDEDGLKLIK